MPRYFFHYVDGTDVLLDPEGVEIADAEIPEDVLWQARSIIAGDAMAGEINLNCSIEVKDEGGRLVHRLPFEEAVTIIQ
ncbi:uncharacterized protein DUF6894 [Sphingomonas sp. F9_3S_D5_B_2]